MITRETIYAALWALAAQAADFVTASRRLRHWTDLSPAEQPALFMAEKGGLAEVKVAGAPVAWTLYADFYLYVHSSDPYAAPATVLNPLLDALEAALAPSPVSGVNNLGLAPMVQHAWIAGKVETDEGVLGDQAVAIVPVEILCTDPGPLAIVPQPLPAPQQGIVVGGGYSLVVDGQGNLQIQTPDGTLVPLVLNEG
jgi:hypothetical protein